MKAVLMRMSVLLTVCLVAALIASSATDTRGAAEDADLELIPDRVMSQPAPQAGVPVPEAEKPGQSESHRIKVFLDEAFQGNFHRGSLAVPLPDSSSSTGWNNRISLDMRAEIRLLPEVSFIFADRLNHFLNQGEDPAEDDLLNDLKECYLTWNIHASHYLDLGRINVKNGVAVGFNPTDYFKKDAVRSRISEDPGVLRENRLGVFMARAQGIWEKGALTLILAPEVSPKANRWWTDEEIIGLGLDRTNRTTRFLSKLTLNVLEDFNPEMLYLYDDGLSSWGLNITKGVGDNIVTYAEWSGSLRRDIASRAFLDGQRDGAIPPSAPRVLSGTDERHFRNQLAVGFSYTEKVNRTTNFEYHFNEAGFSQRNWDDWLHAGAAAKSLLNNPRTEALGRGMLGQLWLVREAFQDAGEPIARHSLFIRSSWQDALVKSLDLTGILNISLRDGSFLAQPMAEYHLSSSWTLSLTMDFFIGSDRTDFGTLSRWGDIRAGVAFYF